LIELVLTKGNAAAEVFRNWIQKNDVHLLRDLMGMLLLTPPPTLSVCPLSAYLDPLTQKLFPLKVTIIKLMSS